MTVDDGLRPVEAVKALRARGVNNPEDMLEHATPEQILAACHRWDGQRGVNPGLLVHWIRAGEFGEPAATPPPSKGEQMRARFDEYAARFPEGAVAEPHARLQARRWPEDDPCPGDLIVIETTYPLISTECDRCDFVAAYPLRSLHVLGEQEPLPRANDSPF
jgi:hypothetical protein